MVRSGLLKDVDFTPQLAAMRELPQRHRSLLEGRRIVVASADLMRRYNDEQGGCQDLVRKLR